MKTDSGRTTSVWMATADVPASAPLAADTSADVCVVGAGLAGLTTAYLLAREGAKVVVLEDGPAGGGMTARTTAHLSNALDDRFYELERLFGEEGARLAAESHTAAIEKIESVAREEGIECEFERLDGYLFLHPTGTLKILVDELEAAHRAGLGEVRRLERAPLEAFDTGPCLHFPRQGQFHPLKYLAGLARAFARDGGRLFKAHASTIGGGADARVETTGGHAVTCGAIVVATNTPVNDRFAIHTKQSPYTTYVVGARVPSGSIPKVLLWDMPGDTDEAYHYVRLESVGDYDVLVVGGEDHKTGQRQDAAQRWGKLEQWARNRFDVIEGIEYRWSGQVMEPFDGPAFIGRNPGDSDNVFIATGDSGMGMTHGTIAGMLLTDLIGGRENRWAELYDPARKTLSAVADYAKENLNVMAQYTDLATPGDVESADDIAAGDGAIIRRGLTKVAAFRDEDGKLYEHSAVCAHLGCVVRFDPAEKTWNCPCHGSRYDARDGHVVNGPANKGLGEA
jgi:glycine/D-amino acid oxidase-like deaminating enzyme/nitrite reductase/ring-hydroxylating ferredoxin subunit